MRRREKQHDGNNYIKAWSELRGCRDTALVGQAIRLPGSFNAC
jgi:hypothetical protein